MAALSNYASLTLTRDTVGLARAGFGIALYLSGYAAFVERTREYGGLEDVVVDFPVTTSPEYLFAQAYFSQSPRPETLKIGRSALPATKKMTLTPTARDTHHYTMTVKGKGVTQTAIDVTSDGTATATEVVTLLKTALNAVVGKNFTATGTATLIVTATAAGDWFALENIDLNDFTVVEDHADPGVATDLAAILVADPDWYVLATGYNSDAYVKAAAAWVQANSRVYFADVVESDAVLVTSDGTQGTGDDLKTLGYSRVACNYYPNPTAMFAAAWLGRCLPRDPGSITFHGKSLTGVPALSLTPTQRTNLTARNMNTMETVSSRKSTFNGKTTDGDWIDATRDLDALSDDVQKSIAELILGVDKVPYTDEGVQLVVNVLRGALNRAVASGILSKSPKFVITYPAVADVDAGDKTARLLPDVKFTGTLAGSIHKVAVLGVISV